MAQQKQSTLIKIDGEDSFKSSYSSSSFCVLFFWADWHKPCKQIESVIEELANDHKEIQFISIDAEEYENITSQFNVSAVPTIILLKNKKEFKRLEAESVPNTVSAINQFSKHSQTASSLTEQKNQSKPTQKK
eukprot:287996_1